MTDERGAQILRILEERRMISFRELAALIYMSEASARRAVSALEREGLVRRVRGGVGLADCARAVVPLALRDGDHSAQKERLARRAAAMVKDGDTLFLDASSTVRRMLPHLATRRNLTVITNNQMIFSGLGPGDLRAYCTGGEYVRENHAFVGPAAEAFIGGLRADKLFFSSQGLALDGEISDPSEAETALRRAMIARATESYCLMDDSKIGRSCLFRLCGREEITGFLTEGPLPWEG